MGAVVLRESRLEDCRELMAKLRREDMNELRAAGVTSYAALREGFDGLECYTACEADTGEVIAMFGASPVTPAGGDAVVWLLGSRRVDDHKLRYLHFGRRAVAQWLRRYDRLYNYVEEHSVKSIRFLKLIGFTFLPERDFVTPQGARFCYFEVKREV